MTESGAAQSATAASEPFVDPHRRRPPAAEAAPRLHRRRGPHPPATDLAAVVRARAVLSRRAQGLPDHITDPTTLDQVAQLVLAARPPP
jgi:hypothetical protein